MHNKGAFFMIGLVTYADGKDVVLVEMGYGDVGVGVGRSKDSKGNDCVVASFEEMKSPAANLDDRITPEDIDTEVTPVMLSFSNRAHAKVILERIMSELEKDDREAEKKQPLSNLSDQVILKNPRSCVGCDRLRWRGTRATTCIELKIETMDATRPEDCPRKHVVFVD
jgi:hypothetical protein